MPPKPPTRPTLAEDAWKIALRAGMVWRAGEHSRSDTAKPRPEARPPLWCCDACGRPSRGTAYWQSGSDRACSELCRDALARWRRFTMPSNTCGR
jgi:hypothetical protein